MTDDGVITNQMLLEHMQSQKYELLQQINMAKNELKQDIHVLRNDMDHRFEHVEKRMKEGFAEARLDRQGLHDDLDATIRMQFKQQKQIAALSGSSLPEEY